MATDTLMGSAVQPDRIRANTTPGINEQIDRNTHARLRFYSNQPPDVIERRLAALDQEWDVERVLEVVAATTATAGLALAFARSRKWLWLTLINQTFLFQHATQGWCPPMAVLRRMGVRTRKEIDAERVALKALRGDFEGFEPGRALDAAGAARLLADARR